jgi:hypothetical protein
LERLVAKTEAARIERWQERMAKTEADHDRPTD